MKQKDIDYLKYDKVEKALCMYLMMPNIYKYIFYGCNDNNNNIFLIK